MSAPAGIVVLNFFVVIPLDFFRKHLADFAEELLVFLLLTADEVDHY